MTRKTEQMWFRCTAEERQTIEAAAAMYRMSLSEFIREMSAWVLRTQPRLIIEPETRQPQTTE